MTSGSSPDTEGALDSILHALDDPEWGRRHLPRLVGLLEHEEDRVRAGAGWAVTHVGASNPDTAAYLARRLGDRVAGGEATLEAEQALVGLAGRYPAVVDDELEAIAEERAADSPTPRSIEGSLLRADYHTPGPGSRGVGRIRFPEGGDPDAPLSIYTDDGENPGAGSGSDSRAGASAEEGDADGEAGTGGADGSATTEGAATAEADGADGGRGGRPGQELWRTTDHLSAIATQSPFADLTVMAQRHRGRYADVYRTRAERDGEEEAVALLLFHVPEAVESFASDLGEALALWEAVDDHPSVVTCYDWGTDPRPWALVEYTGESLTAMRDLDVTEARWHARHLASAVVHVHENGVVHGGLDPGNVGYYGNLLAEDERQAPLVTNVAVLSAVRLYFDPTTRLDPRYAAPEFFDDRFGRVDHASDLYGLGALVYHLYTGRPPYAGEYAAVRESVLTADPPRPSDVVDVPPGVDEVVRKAMATEKLHRYESAGHLAADLRAIGGVG